MTAHLAPTVSVILPTYNREAFLADAIASIRAQLWTDWELVVVDDGSTDGTRATIAALTTEFTDRVRYVHQENGGAYAARNTGLAHARGEFVAFFDSDDLWLPHHVSRCVSALQAHPEVDWVYGACRLVDHQTGRVLDESTFYPQGQPRPFLSLKTTTDGDLRIITDTRVTEFQIQHGLYCGLQNSVMRRVLFANDRFYEPYRVVEDVIFLVRALASGARLAYYDDAHVVYRVHDDNSSASASVASDEKALAIFRELVDGYERLAGSVAFNGPERRALNRRLSREYFWHLGYQGFWVRGRRREALEAFRRGISFSPWDLRLWKTYLLAVARTH